MTLPRSIVDALRCEDTPACVLDTAGRIAFLNAGWDRMALTACAPGTIESGCIRGTFWLEHLRGADRAFFDEALRRAFWMERGNEQRALVHLYENNTADRVRIASTELVPIYEPGRRLPSWLLVKHELLSDTPVDEVYELAEPSDARHRDAAGRVHQCSCCRRVRSVDDQRWEFVPAWVEAAPPSLSLTVCVPCLDAYYDDPEEVIWPRQDAAAFAA